MEDVEPRDPAALEITSTQARKDLSRLLDRVEQGETFVITRRGRVVAHLEPAPKSQHERVRRTLNKIEELRRGLEGVSLDELLKARHEGHRY
jgi:prevent-host-death family protein